MLWVLGALMLAGVLLALRACYQFRDNVLLGPLIWVAVSFFVVWLGEFLLALWAGSGTDETPIRLAAAAVIFCPGMSVLGSKRPQHGGWHFVVLTMWIIIALPAMEMLISTRGESMRVGNLRSWFMLGAILLNTANYLPTRFWGSCAMVSMAQLLLLAPQLPSWFQIPLWWGLLGEPPEQATMVLLAMGLMVSAAAWASWQGGGPSASWDRRWLRFRDRFGAFWAVRVLQRVNQLTIERKWGIMLTWWGFRHVESSSATDDGSSEGAGASVGDSHKECPDSPPFCTEDQWETICQAMENMLRRFDV